MAAQLAFQAIETIEEAADGLRDHGIDADHLAKGWALLRTAKAAAIDCIKAWSRVVGFNESVEQADARIRKVYARDLKLARAVVSPSEEAYGRLGLRGRRNWNRRSGWTGQARAMYRALDTDPDLGALFQSYPLDASAGLDGLDALDTALTDRTAAHEAAKTSTRVRNEAIDALRAFHSEIIAFVLIAFEGTQMPEAFGITAE